MVCGPLSGCRLLLRQIPHSSQLAAEHSITCGAPLERALGTNRMLHGRLRSPPKTDLKGDPWKLRPRAWKDLKSPSSPAHPPPPGRRCRHSCPQATWQGPDSDPRHRLGPGPWILPGLVAQSTGLASSAQPWWLSPLPTLGTSLGKLLAPGARRAALPAESLGPAPSLPASFPHCWVTQSRSREALSRARHWQRLPAGQAPDCSGWAASACTPHAGRGLGWGKGSELPETPELGAGGGA